MKRGKIINLLLLIFLGLIIFTPVGFHMKVLINRVIVSNPDLLEPDQRSVIKDFNWHLKDQEGKAFNLSQARGKVIFLNFWASWCPPCVAEMPAIVDLYQDYQKEVVFVFVARDEFASIEKFMRKHEYDFPVYFEQEKPPEGLGCKSLPTTYIISKTGDRVVFHTGSAAWNSTMTRQLLDNLLSE